MNPDSAITAPPPRKHRRNLIPAILLCAFILGCSILANLSWDIKDPADFKYIPPFKAGVDRNMNLHLGAEYLSIARAIYEGRGFSDVFNADTGATAWMPPVLCYLQAGLLWTFEGDIDSVMNTMLVFQDIVLMLTCWMVLALCGTNRWWAFFVLLLGISLHFRDAFQMTHDCVFLMLVMDVLVAGMCWGRPFDSRGRAVAWGLYGGFAAMSSPVAGLCWIVLSLVFGRGHWRNLAIAGLVAILAVMPWTIRNYYALGKFIPVKSNLAYELYQSQCLQPDGVLQTKTFGSHPWAHNNKARRDYRKLGEIEFLKQKQDLFVEAVRKDPGDFVRRVGQRFVAVTLEYHPNDPVKEREEFPEALWATHVTYPLPFLAWCWLMIAYIRFGLTRFEKVVFWLYIAYYLPYILISYYGRYEFPGLALKALLVIWLGGHAVNLVRRLVTRRMEKTN